MTQCYDAVLVQFGLVNVQQLVHFALLHSWIVQGALEDYVIGVSNYVGLVNGLWQKLPSSSVKKDHPRNTRVVQ